MANTHDYSIANDTGSAVRTDLNTLFTEVEATNAGATAPSNLATGKLWYDTANSLLKQYDGSAWVTISLGATPDIGTPSAGVVTNLSGVLPVGVTGGSGLDALSVPALSTAEMWTFEGSSFAGSVDPVLNFARIDEPAGFGGVVDGSGITVSATGSLFAFPSTGHWWVSVCWTFHRPSGSDRAAGVYIKTTVDADAGSPTYNSATFGATGLYHDGAGDRYGNVSLKHIFDVTNIATHKLRIAIDTPSGTTYTDNTADMNRCTITFFKLGNT